MIGFAGLTHLGLVSSVAAAAKGFDVVGYDQDAVLVDEINRGQLRVVEPGLPELLASVRSRLTLTADVTDLGRCDVVYIAVDVPTDADSRSDVGPVEALVNAVAAQAKPGAAIVVLSQVHPGFTRSLRGLVEKPGLARLFYQVETLIFGRAVQRALEPERFMVGLADPAEPIPPALRQFLEAFWCPILPMRYESAELCKISINMFLVASVTTTNMLAEVCEAVGAEWREIAPALRLDRRIGPYAYLTPGLGVGGGNLTRDLATIQMLAAQHGTDAGIIDAWNENTAHRQGWVLGLLAREVLSSVEKPRIGVWGIAYKEDTQFTKNSPAVALIQALRDVPVSAYDPAARLGESERPAWMRVASSALDACDGADALAIMTPWSEFAQADLSDVASRMRGRLLIDPFGVVTPEAAAGAGFIHHRLGTGRMPSA